MIIKAGWKISYRQVLNDEHADSMSFLDKKKYFGRESYYNSFFLCMDGVLDVLSKLVANTNTTVAL